MRAPGLSPITKTRNPSPALPRPRRSRRLHSKLPTRHHPASREFRTSTKWSSSARKSPAPLRPTFPRFRRPTPAPPKTATTKTSLVWSKPGHWAARSGESKTGQKTRTTSATTRRLSTPSQWKWATATPLPGKIQCRKILVCLETVFPVNPDSASLTGDKSEADDVIQVFLPRPPQRTTSDRVSKPSRKQKRNPKVADAADGVDVDDRDQQQQFSYSVKYFTWTLSDDEDEGDDCQIVTLPLNRLRISNPTPGKNGCQKSKKNWKKLSLWPAWKETNLLLNHKIWRLVRFIVTSMKNFQDLVCKYRKRSTKHY